MNLHFEFLVALSYKRREMIVSKYFKFEKSLNLHEFLFVLKSKIMKRSCRIMKVLRNFGCEIIENFGIF